MKPLRMPLSATTNCLLCGSKCRQLLSVRDYLRNDPNTYDLNWCDRCDFGRVAGDFTPKQVLSFYPDRYYTHQNQQRPQQLGFLDKLRVHLAWRRDHGRPLGPDELPRYSAICDIGCGDGYNLGIFK